MKNDLKEIRKIKGITLDQLAKLTGIHPPKLNRIENDLIEPSQEEIEKISTALRLSPRKIFPNPEAKELGMTTQYGNIFDELYEQEKAIYEGREKWSETYDRILNDLQKITLKQIKSLSLTPDEARTLLYLLLQLKDKMEPESFKKSKELQD